LGRPTVCDGKKRRKYTMAVDGHQGIIFDATTNQNKAGALN